MNDHIQETPETDEFDLIELGSVSEETKGGQFEGIELAVGPNSKL